MVWQVREPQEHQFPTKHEVHDRRIWPGTAVLVAASRRGKLHAHEGKYRDDAFSIRKRGCWAIAAVADGAGSRPLARHGAQTATRAAVSHLSRALSWRRRITAPVLAGMMREAMDQARDSVLGEAQKLSRPFSDFACTLLVFACRVGNGPTLIGFSQVGDGLIAYVSGHDLHIPIKPHIGLYANETMFIVSDDGSHPTSQTAVVETGEVPDVVAAMTDGISDDLDRFVTGPTGFLRQARQVLLAGGEHGRKLLRIINYDLRGSFDDRTAVLLLRMDR